MEEKEYLATLGEADWISKGYRVVTQHEYEVLLEKAKRLNWIIKPFQIPAYVKMLIFFGAMEKIIEWIWAFNLFSGDQFKTGLTTTFIIFAAIGALANLIDRHGGFN